MNLFVYVYREALSPPGWCLPDPNPDDSLQFFIVAGNDAGVFKIAPCGGQIRVADAVLDFDAGPRTYNLTVLVTDDGTPSLNATAIFQIRVRGGPTLGAVDGAMQLGARLLAGRLLRTPAPAALVPLVALCTVARC
jgi:hypothetical protein